MSFIFTLSPFLRDSSKKVQKSRGAECILASDLRDLTFSKHNYCMTFEVIAEGVEGEHD